ncbi:STAS domain-containing protein [Rhodococcus sp. NPDC003322]
MRIHLHHSKTATARSRVGGAVGPTIATLSGDLDLPAVPGFVDTINRAIREAERTVIVDLSRVDFVSISGVQALADAQDRANCKGLAMLLVHDGPVLSRPLEVTGMANHFHSFPSVRSAIDARRTELAAHAGLDKVHVKPRPA